MYNSMENKMSAKRYPNLSIVEYQEIWRNQKSVEEEAACGFFDKFRKDPIEKKDDPLAPNAEDEKDKKPPAKDKDQEKDKRDTYPPIVTIDGRVDTDIDHLIEDLADEYKGPVDDIPSKFPKPHVFSVIEGSLDDDVDSYANDDGTMEHTLVDAPKNFNPKDLKDVASNDVPRTPGHTKSGQIEASHTDRSHNKMNVDHMENDVGHDGSERDEGRAFVQKNRSSEQLKRIHTEQRRSIEYACTEEHKMQQEYGKEPTSRNGRKHTAEGTTRKTRDTEGHPMPKSSSCLDHNRGHRMMNLMKSESADGNAHVFRHNTTDNDADQAFNSRAVVLMQADSSAYTTDVRECSSFKDTRLKDTESAVYMQAYTESLTCTFTDESFRDGHASLDMSALRADPDQSQSLTETESVSDMQVTRARRRVRPAEMYESYDYNLDTKVGTEFEHRLYHFPSYSDDSLTKSSDLYPRSRYMTHSTSHLSSSQVQPGSRQPRPNSDPTNLSVSMKSSHSSSQTAAVCGFQSESCQNRLEMATVVEDSVSTNLKYKSVGQAEYTHTAYLEDTPIHTGHLEDTPVHTAYPKDTPVQTAYSEDTPIQKESSRRSFSSGHRFDHGQMLTNESTHHPLEQMKAGGKCHREAKVKEALACEHRKAQQKLLEASHGRSRELETPLTSLDHRGSEKYQSGQPHSVGVGTPKEYRSMSTQNEIMYDESVSQSRELGIQVTIEACDRKAVETNREMIQPQTPSSAPGAHRNTKIHDSGKVKNSKKLSIQAERLTADVSDSESLDSEANYLLHQLQMAQMTKRKANSLLRHVQTILEQSDTVEDKQLAVKRGVDEKRISSTPEQQRSKQTSGEDPTQIDLHVERSASTSSTCRVKTGDRRSGIRDTELKTSPQAEGKASGFSHAETGDRGLVQTLVNTWDRHHRAVSQVKGDKVTAGTRSQAPTTNKWSTRQTQEHRESCVHGKNSESHQCKAPTRDKHAQHQPNKPTQRTLEKRNKSQDGETTEKRVRGNSFERSHRSQKLVKTEQTPGLVAASTKVDPVNAAYDSTSLASVSLDSVCDNNQPPGRHQEGILYVQDAGLDKRAASLPRKIRHKRRNSPDAFSCKDVLKSKWRCDVDVKRIKARSSSIKDSLRAAFKVAEESMTAAARVAEALNIVMKASLISPPSSSSVEGKYTGLMEQTKSPVVRPKRLEAAAMSCRSKTRTEPADTQSPDDVSLYQRSEQEDSAKYKARRLDKISERSEKKKRSAHSYCTSQERTFSHKTSLSSPLRRDTCSRKPKNGRASQHQLDTKAQIPDSRDAHSKSSVTLSEYSPQAWGDSTSVNKDVPDQTPQVNGQQIIVQVAYTNSPESASPQQETFGGKVQVREAPKLDILAKDDQSYATQDTMVSFDSGEIHDRSKVEGHEVDHATEDTLSKARYLGKKPGVQSPGVSECELSSRLTLSREEWTIPNSYCSSARKIDSYFTQKPPVIDQNLQSISLSTKQIIRRQLIGSCVDPGCVDSAGSDSVESNSNFNRSTAGKQLHLNIAHKIEQQQQRERRLNQVIMSKCRQEMELSQSAEPLIIWQCDSSLQYETECFPSDTNVFLQPDRGKSSSLSRCQHDSPQPAYRCISRSLGESNTSRRATVQVDDTRGTSYQLHEEEILQIEDYFESSCMKQEVAPCVATLCYTDLSSPASSCFDVQDFGGICPGHPELFEAPNTVQTDMSHRIEFDRNCPLPQTKADDQRPSLEGGVMRGCPQDLPHEQSTPAPRPRARKLQQSDTDSFPLPGRAAQIKKFSPIFEELWSEDATYSNHGAYQICPDFKGRSQNINNSNNNSSNNNNSSSNNKYNNSSSSSNNNGTDDAGDKILETVPSTQTGAHCGLWAFRWVARAAGAVDPSCENTSKSTGAQPVPSGLFVGDENSHAATPGRLTWPSFSGTTCKRVSVDLDRALVWNVQRYVNAICSRSPLTCSSDMLDALSSAGLEGHVHMDRQLGAHMRGYASSTDMVREDETHTSSEAESESVDSHMEHELAVVVENVVASHLTGSLSQSPSRDFASVIVNRNSNNMLHMTLVDDSEESDVAEDYIDVDVSRGELSSNEHDEISLTVVVQDDASVGGVSDGRTLGETSCHSAVESCSSEQMSYEDVNVNNEHEAGHHSNSPDQQGSSHGRPRVPGRHTATGARPPFLDYGQPDDVEDVNEDNVFNVDMAFIQGIIVDQVVLNPPAQQTALNPPAQQTAAPPAVIGFNGVVQTAAPAEHGRLASDVDPPDGPDYFQPITGSVSAQALSEHEVGIVVVDSIRHTSSPVQGRATVSHPSNNNSPVQGRATVSHPSNNNSPVQGRATVSHPSNIISPVQGRVTPSHPPNNSARETPTVEDVSNTAVDFPGQSDSEDDAAQTMPLDKKEQAESAEGSGMAPDTSNITVDTTDFSDTCRGLPVCVNDDTTADSLETTSTSVLDEIRQSSYVNTDPLSNNSAQGTHHFSIVFPGVTEATSWLGDSPDHARPKPTADAAPAVAQPVSDKPGCNSQTDISPDSSYDDVQDEQEMLASAENDFAILPARGAVSPVMVPGERTQRDADDLLQQVIKGKCDQSLGPNIVSDDGGCCLCPHDDVYCLDVLSQTVDLGDIDSFTCVTDNPGDDRRSLHGHAELMYDNRTEVELAEGSKGDATDTVSGIYRDVSEDSCHGDTSSPGRCTSCLSSQACSNGPAVARTSDLECNRQSNARDSNIDSLVTEEIIYQPHWDTLPDKGTHARHVYNKVELGQAMDTADISTWLTSKHKNKHTEKELDDFTGITQCSDELLDSTLLERSPQKMATPQTANDLASFSYASHPLQQADFSGAECETILKCELPEKFETLTRFDIDDMLMARIAHEDHTDMAVVSPESSSQMGSVVTGATTSHLVTSMIESQNNADADHLVTSMIESQNNADADHLVTSMIESQNNADAGHLVTSMIESQNNADAGHLVTSMIESQYNADAGHLVTSMIESQNNADDSTDVLFVPRVDTNVNMSYSPTKIPSSSKVMISPRDRESSSSTVLSARDGESSSSVVLSATNISASNNKITCTRSTGECRDQIHATSLVLASSINMADLAADDEEDTKMVSSNIQDNCSIQGAPCPKEMQTCTHMISSMAAPNDNKMMPYASNIRQEVSSPSNRSQEVSSPSNSRQEVSSPRNNDHTDMSSPRDSCNGSMIMPPSANRHELTPTSEDLGAPEVCPSATIQGSTTHVSQRTSHSGNEVMSSPLLHVHSKSMSPRDSHSANEVMSSPLLHVHSTVKSMSPRDSHSNNEVMSSPLLHVHSKSMLPRDSHSNNEMMSSPLLHVHSKSMLPRDSHSGNEVMSSPLLHVHSTVKTMSTRDTQNCNQSLSSSKLHSTAEIVLASIEVQSTKSTVIWPRKAHSTIQTKPSSHAVESISCTVPLPPCKDQSRGKANFWAQKVDSKTELLSSLDAVETTDRSMWSDMPAHVDINHCYARMPAQVDIKDNSACLHAQVDKDCASSPAPASSGSDQTSSSIHECTDTVLITKLLDVETNNSTPTQASPDTDTFSSCTSHISCNCNSDVEMIPCDITDNVEMISCDIRDNVEISCDTTDNGEMMSCNITDNVEVMSCDIRDTIEVMCCDIKDNVEVMCCDIKDNVEVMCCDIKDNVEVMCCDSTKYDETENIVQTEGGQLIRCQITNDSTSTWCENMDDNVLTDCEARCYAEPENTESLCSDIINYAEGSCHDSNLEVTYCMSHPEHEIGDDTRSKQDLLTQSSFGQHPDSSTNLRDLLTQNSFGQHSDRSQGLTDPNIQSVQSQDVAIEESGSMDCPDCPPQKEQHQGLVGEDQKVSVSVEMDSCLGDGSEIIHVSEKDRRKSDNMLVVARDVFSPWETDNDNKISDSDSQLGDGEQEGDENAKSQMKMSVCRNMSSGNHPGGESSHQEADNVTSICRNEVTASGKEAGQGQTIQNSNTDLYSRTWFQDEPDEEENNDHVVDLDNDDRDVADPCCGLPPSLQQMADISGSGICLENKQSVSVALIPADVAGRHTSSSEMVATDTDAPCPGVCIQLGKSVKSRDVVKQPAAHDRRSPRHVKGHGNKEDMKPAQENHSERLLQDHKQHGLDVFTGSNMAEVETISLHRRAETVDDCLQTRDNSFLSLAQVELSATQDKQNEAHECVPNLLVQQTQSASKTRLPTHAVCDSGKTIPGALDKIGSMPDALAGGAHEGCGQQGNTDQGTTGNTFHETASTRSVSNVTSSISVTSNTAFQCRRDSQLHQNTSSLVLKYETSELAPTVAIATSGLCLSQTEGIVTQDQFPDAQVILEATDKWLSRITDMCKSPDFLTCTSSDQQLHALAAQCKSEILAISQSSHFPDSIEFPSRASTPSNRMRRGYGLRASSHAEDTQDMFKTTSFPEDTSINKNTHVGKQIFTPRPPSGGCRNIFSNFRQRSARLRPSVTIPQCSATSADPQTESGNSNVPPGCKPDTFSLIVAPCSQPKPSTTASDDKASLSTSNVINEKINLSTTNVINNPMNEKISGNYSNSSDNVMSPQVSEKRKDTADDSAGLISDNVQGNELEEDGEKTANSSQRPEIGETKAGNCGSKLFKRMFGRCNDRKKTDPEANVCESSWKAEKSQDGTDSRPFSECRTPYTSAVHTPATTTSFECISDETEDDGSTPPAVFSSLACSGIPAQISRNEGPKSRTTPQSKKCSHHSSGQCNKNDISRVKHSKTAAASTTTTTTTTTTTHGKRIKEGPPPATTYTRRKCLTERPSPAATTTHGKCIIGRPPLPVTTSKMAASAGDSATTHINRLKVEPLKVKSTGNTKSYKQVMTMQEFERIQQDRHLSEAFARINSSKACVDCHMNSRYLDKQGSSVRRRRERVNYNCLIALENIKFLEMLRYKKSAYGREEQLKDFKKNYQKMMEMGKHTDQWQELQLLDKTKSESGRCQFKSAPGQA